MFFWRPAFFVDLSERYLNQPIHNEIKRLIDCYKYYIIFENSFTNPKHL